MSIPPLSLRRLSRLAPLSLALLLAACARESTAPSPATGATADPAPVTTQAEDVTNAADATVGDVEISDAWTRAMAPGAQVAGGYMTLRNAGAQDDRLLSIGSPVAARVEIHEMRMVEGMMQMRHLADGLRLPAGGEVVLKPGGYHLMFIQPAQSFAEGETVPATLVFEQAGEVEVEFSVLALGASGLAAGHDPGADDGDAHDGHH